jgi:protein-S-isoprenylcysteine O-methyltransferase Ste14
MPKVGRDNHDAIAWIARSAGLRAMTGAHQETCASFPAKHSFCAAMLSIQAVRAYSSDCECRAIGALPGKYRQLLAGPAQRRQLRELNKKAFAGIFFLLLVMAALIFVPAWTLDYWQAWTFLAVFAGSASAITLYLMTKDPELLERRVHAGPLAEKETSQKVIQTLSSIGFAAVLIVSAFDHRLGWTSPPPYISLAGEALVALGFLIVFWVYKENTFASATIELAPEQTVISTGPYKLVRHPMYMGALVMFVGIPLALASLWGLLVIALMLPALIWRLLNEETFLEKNLPGYPEYQNKVRHHLVPFLW